jgi:hypothetical protein
MICTNATATEDYLPGAIGVPADGCGLCLQERHSVILDYYK